jgi:dihydroflavonol-4-reductase
MHVDAIKNDETKGERVLSSSETKSFVEIAKYLKSIYPKSKVKSVQAPTAIIKFLSIFDSTIKTILPQLGKPMRISNAKAKRLMGMSFIPAEVILRESADYLIKNGL